MIHKEGGGEKGEGGSKGDGKDAREGEEREGGASLEDTSNGDNIYDAIASGQGTTTTNSKDDAKKDDDKEGCMVVIPQFWVCTMVHMEAVEKLTTERDIDCLKNLKDVTCRDSEDGTRFELRLTFNIKTKEYFKDELLIKRYEVSNLLLDYEPIIKNVTGWNIHWKEGSGLKCSSDLLHQGS